MSTLRQGQILVVLQFLLLALLAVNPAVLAAFWQGQWTVWLIFACSVVVGLSALWANRPGNFNIHPHPHPDGVLIRHGPYRWVRHPMYSAVLLFATACVLADPSPTTLLYLVGLLLVLLGKAWMEERLMASRHGEYAQYVRSTKRLIPWVL